MNYIKLLGGIFLGWTLGRNDAANIFGGAIASEMVRFRMACIFMAVFIILGAVTGGTHAIKTIGGLAGLTIDEALIVTIASGITTMVMIGFHLPISTSQAVVGAIIGIGIIGGHLNTSGLKKVVTCWIASPLSAASLAIILHVIIGKIILGMKLHFIAYDNVMRLALIMAGSYSAYALGANNSANATGVFYQSGILSAYQASLIGGISIAAGAVTLSKNVAMTIGKRLLNLDAFSAFIVVLSEAITVHIFAIIGVPVSTTQAVVGAILGIGVVKGIRVINIRTLCQILYGWVLTPLIGGIFSYILYRVFC